MEKQSTQKGDSRELIKFSTLTIILLIFLMLFYTGCNYDCDQVTYTYYDATYQSIDSLRSTVSVEPAKDIEEPGGLYYKDGYVFINERSKGIHILDNRQPANPVSIAFLNIPGNFGLAAKGDFLYADSYSDLLVWEISEPTAIHLVKRIQDVFQNFYQMGFYVDSFSGTVTTYTERTETKKECDFEDPRYLYEDVDLVSSFENSDSGVGGSMARFVVSNDVLYTIDYYTMSVFDVSSASDPQSEGTIDIGWGIETIFPYEDKLFIGSESGMIIYSNSNPITPEFLSSYSHVSACDPVVVQGDYAYVTLRSGNSCSGFTNQLEIINIANASSPFLEKTYEMSNPHGLGVKGNCLFICEGDFGLRSFALDPNDPTTITQTAYNDKVAALDVITLPGVLLMVGKDGFYQYEYSCGEELKYLSKIDIKL